jgi:hypothetical protein
MTHPDIATALAKAQLHDRLRAAESFRLVALARCCRPTAWRRAAHAAADAAATMRRRLHPQPAPAVCCA